MDSIKNAIKRFFNEHGSAILIFFTRVLAFIIGIIKTVARETINEIKGGV